MGVIRNGGNGVFSGKAGSFIGSTWCDISYIRGIPKISKKPKTLKQLEQQAKFATAIKFLQPVKDLLNVGFGNDKQGKASGYNMAVKHILDHAIRGTYPDLAIAYPKVSFTKGSVAVSIGVEILAENGNLVLKWSSDLNPYNAFPEDEITAPVFDPGSNIFLHGPIGVTRVQGEITMSVLPKGIFQFLRTYSKS